ncbi:MAG: hypothetical protein ACK2TV_08300, partial [Anaerolineales bacterium]
GKKLYFARLAVAGCFSILAGAVLAELFLPDIKHTFVFSAGRAGLIGMLAAVLYLILPERENRNRIQAWNLLLILLVSFDLVSAGWGLNPGIESEFYDVSSSLDVDGRIWMPANLEYDLKFNKYLRFDTFAPDIRWEDMHRELLPNLPMLQGISLVNNFDPMVPGYYQEWMDGINEKYPDRQILDLMSVSAVIEINDKGFAEPVSLDNQVSPVRMVGCAEVVSPENLDLEMIIGSDINLLENVVITSDNQISCEKGSSGKAEVIQETNGYLKLSVNLDQDGWIFWSQTWYPGWVYQIDMGEIAKSYRVNYLFQGAPVPAGARQVEFIYRPTTVIWGSMISGVSLAAMILVLVLRKKPGRIK